MRLTDDVVRKEVIRQGYVPFRKKYAIGYKDKVLFKDKEGYKYSVRWENFLRSKNYQIVSPTNIFSIDNIKLYITKNDLPVELLSDTYRTALSKLLFKDKNGHRFEISWVGLGKNRYLMCEKCMLVQKGKDERVPEEIIKSLFEENGYFLPHYKNGTNSLKQFCIDGEGFKGEISYRNLRMGKRWERFSTANSYSIENICHYLKTNKIDLTLLSTIYNGSRNKLKFKCSCGDLFHTTLDSLQFKEVSRCPKCSRKQSVIEYKTEILLKELNIKYKKEYIFKDCGQATKGSRLRFDFYLCEQNKIIEVDGKQHFEPVGFGGVDANKALQIFKKQKMNDEIKNNYCLCNNIPLLRIPYTDYTNESYKEKINEFTRVDVAN